MVQAVIMGILSLSALVLVVLNIMNVTPHDITSAIIWLILSASNIMNIKMFFEKNNKKSGIFYIVLLIICVVFCIMDIIKLL